MFQSWTPLRLDLIFKKAVKTDDLQSPYDDTHISRNSRHIESRDKNKVNGNATMFEQHIVRHITLPTKSALQVAVFLYASAEGMLNAAIPATISKGASA